MQTLAHLTFAKLQKLVCVYTVAHNFGICTWPSEHMQHTRDVRTSRVALGLQQHTCDVGTFMVAVGNKIQLFCC